MSAGLHILDAVFSWLDADACRYWSLAWFTFGVCVLLAWRPRAGEKTAGGFGVALFSCSVFVCIAAFRWPVLFFPDHLNIDESQMIAGAITLRHDPVFWRSVEGQTIGPIDYYALVPATFLPGKYIYVGARLLAMLLAGSVVVLGYVCARFSFSERIARCGALVLLAFFAFTTDAHFVHYSSEHVPIFLIALAMTCLLKARAVDRLGWVFLAGLALGAAPLAKLQVAPVAVWILICSAGYFCVAPTYRGKRMSAVAALALGVATVWLGVAVYVAAFDVWRHMRISYLEANFFYVETDTEQLPRLKAWLRIISEMARNGSFAPLLGSTLALGAAAVLARRKPEETQVWPLMLAAGSLLSALAGVLIASRTFAHYWLLFTPAVAVVAAWGLESLGQVGQGQARKLQIAGWLVFFGLGIGLPAVGRMISGNPFAGHYRDYRNMVDGPSNPVVDEIKRWVKPGDSLAVWGWEPALYVRTRCWQATRDPSTRRLVERSTQIGYFRERYLHDLEESRPRVLVDTTGAHRRGFGFESFPEFQDYLGEHYRLHREIDERRIYLRRDIALAGGHEADGVPSMETLP